MYAYVCRDWHIGSGSGQGPLADALVLKDEHGLPYIPGKTIQGLFLEAVTTLKEVGFSLPLTVEELFGKEGRDYNSKRALLFNSACIDDNLKRKLINKDDGVKNFAFYEYISSTAIDEKTGIAVKNTLKTIEVCIPLTLNTEIEIITTDKEKELDKKIEEKLEEKLELAAKTIRYLGSHRHRGLGKCSIEKV